MWECVVYILELKSYVYNWFYIKIFYYLRVILFIFFLVNSKYYCIFKGCFFINVYLLRGFFLDVRGLLKLKVRIGLFFLVVGIIGVEGIIIGVVWFEEMEYVEFIEAL